MNSSACSQWAAAARRLAPLLPLSLWHPETVAWVKGRSRASRDPWAVAFSGGADSLALLLLLWAHWPERREKLLALHFDHRLRGAESREDARFCARVCRSLGVRLQSGSWRRGRGAGVSEAAARDARMDFFRQAMEKNGIRALWLAHQMEDVVESMFMRLARGSGSAGLAAPRPLQMMSDGSIRLRPLLGVKKTALCSSLRAAGLTWREDSSNATRAYLRNRMRHEVVPAWLASSPERDALAGAALARELLQEDDSALDAWVDELRPLPRKGCLELTKLDKKPKALWRRVLRRWLASTPYRGDLSRQGFDLLLHACMKGAPFRQSIGNEGFAVSKGGTLRFEKQTVRRRSKAPRT